MGPHMYAYLAAAYSKAGNKGRAHAAAEHVRAALPVFSVRNFIETLFPDAEAHQPVFSALRETGLDLRRP